MNIISTNPSRNYEPIGEVQITSNKEIEALVKNAHNAQKKWEKLKLSKRISYLNDLLNRFSLERDTLSQLSSQEMGMPISQARGDMENGLNYFSWYLENASKYLSPEITYQKDGEINEVHYMPIGVVASVISWNFPFSIFVWQVIQNLIVGNVVIFKHSEETPLFGKEIERIFKESNIPEGVFTEVFGGKETGEFLMQQDIDMITFTGSSKVGKKLYQIGAEKFIPVLMELGGSAPGIVFEDADLDNIIESLYIKRFLNCGQCCDGLKRLIVHESRLDETIEKLTEIIGNKKFGLSEDEDTQIGPLASKTQVDTIEKQVKDAINKGAKAVLGGKRPNHLKGAFFEPTILVNVTKDMAVWNEEVFGPVLPVVSFKNYEEAITLANDTKYGLGGYVFTEDKKLFNQTVFDVKTGMLAHNSTSYVKPCNPFGGIKESGMSRENGKFGFHDVCQIKIISRDE
ncbi:aldehyde dehydrogenase family protein [Hwangdonia lutea]|uniref:Aldehyde dehydrogenase family protein n=1 Tax=Hwangdonia lutea TaxID=3075823 RepID=A0AA97HQE6_9FLAO|nr:aldehyde dehydrogenase family protein [Hwangdonia sp. SCSIO 19198]WOD43891.1 aldehyde dehydrogenase family protein [Hwangdonia sp. SCSIO 19198]